MRLFLMILLLSSSPAFADDLPWYEGGTLQKATVADWDNATPQNQLATSGDFIASLAAVSDISKEKASEQEQIKKRAIELRNCVNKAIDEPDTPPERPVAELVVLCTILKGN